MDILFICDHSLDLVGGSVESLKVIINVVKDKYNVGLYTPGINEYSDIKVKHYHQSSYKSMKAMIKHPLEFISYYIRLLNTIRKSDVKVIHTQEQIGYFAVAFFKRMGWIDRDIVLIHTERGLYEKYSYKIRLLFFFSLPFTNKIVVTTNYNKKLWTDAIVKKYPGQEKKYIVIENTAGSRFEEFNQNKKNIDSSSVTLGFAGRYCNWKGWNLVEDICKNLSSDSRIKVHIAMGCENEKDIEKTKALFSRIKNWLGNRFTGDINNNLAQMDDFYYNLDIFAITSDPGTESFGRVLVEAMSRKAVVMGTDCGGATEVISNPPNICNTAEEFVDRIEELVNNRILLEEEQEKCYLRVHSYYSLKNNMDKHIELYKYYFGY